MAVHAPSPFVQFEQVLTIEADDQIFVNYGREFFLDGNGQLIDRGFNYE